MNDLDRIADGAHFPTSIPLADSGPTVPQKLLKSRFDLSNARRCMDQKAGPRL